MSVFLLKSIFVNREVSLWYFSLELVLKVRIQNPNARENDFIEVELDRQELTYRSLLRVCCRELDISTEHVEKIRKLPNTMLRKVQGRRPCILYTSLCCRPVSGSRKGTFRILHVTATNTEIHTHSCANLKDASLIMAKY